MAPIAAERSTAPANSQIELRDCVKYRRRKPGCSFGKPSQSPRNALLAALVAWSLSSASAIRASCTRTAISRATL
jgi:hypothetical protein